MQVLCLMNEGLCQLVQACKELCGVCMKVMHIITDLADGGAEGVLYRLVINEKTNEHHIISLMGEGKYGSLLREAGVSVTTLDMPRGGISIVGVYRLWKTVRLWKPNVVQTWMYHADFLGGLVCRMAGVKPIVWGVRHSDLDPERSSRATIMIAKLSSRLSRFIPKRIAVCAHRAVLVHAGLGYAADRMVVIPNGYDLTRFVPDAGSRSRLRQELGVPDSMPLIGMVARSDPQKDHANLINALALLSQMMIPFRVILVGAGMTRDNQEVAGYISQCGLKDTVLLLGPRGDIPAVMNALDIHVLSSSSEAFPNVLAEAMACGTPCVTTDVGDAAFIVGNMGWVVPPRAPAELSVALAQAITEWKDEDTWSERKRMARERITDNFSIERMVKRYREVWADAINASQRKVTN